MNRENQDAWLAIAATKSSREIEREVAKVNPQAPQPERFQYTDGDTVRAQLDIPEQLMKKLRRIQDIESQRRGMAATFIEALDGAAEVYLDRNEPARKAERALARRAKSELARASDTITQTRNASKDVEHRQPEKTAENVRVVMLNEQHSDFSVQCDGELVPGRVDGVKHTNLEPIPALSKHVVYARDESRCTHSDEHGRCPATRWLHVHHIISREDGGSNEPENLTLLCEPHHRFAHLGSRVHSPTLEYRAS